jgi:hypothetical protein
MLCLARPCSKHSQLSELDQEAGCATAMKHDRVVLGSGQGNLRYARTAIMVCALANTLTRFPVFDALCAIVRSDVRCTAKIDGSVEFDG